MNLQKYSLYFKSNLLIARSQQRAQQYLLGNHIVDALAKLENLENSFCRRACGFPCSTYTGDNQGEVKGFPTKNFQKPKKHFDSQQINGLKKDTLIESSHSIVYIFSIGVLQDLFHKTDALNYKDEKYSSLGMVIKHIPHEMNYH